MKIINSTQFDEVTSEGIVVVKVDVDQDVDLARRYGIQSIPNVIFFKDGKAVDQLVGFAGKDGVLEKLNPLL